MNSRWFCLLLSLALISCANQRAPVFVNSVNTLTPSPALVVQPTFIITPSSIPEYMITATPIQFNPDTQDITNVIDGLFDVNLKTDWLHPVSKPAYEIGKPELIDVTDQIEIQELLLAEIADSFDYTYRAYVVFESDPNSCKTCKLYAVYVENRISEETYKLVWNYYKPYAATSNLVWLGDSVLVFLHKDFMTSAQLVGIDVSKQDFVYYAGISFFP